MEIVGRLKIIILIFGISMCIYIYIHVTLVLYIKHVDELDICTAFSAVQKECDV